MDETYAGWTNRETWAFMLNVQNDEGLLSMVREGYLTDADALSDWADTMFTRSGYEYEMGNQWPAALADIASEIGSLWRVNWNECFEALSE